MRYRIEKDSLGEKVIPLESYYGIKSLRSKDAYQITKHGQCRQIIKALATIKKVFAKTNYEFGLLDKKVAEAIMLSADEILNGRLHGQFITDSIQDGYGYGMNDNANEVIANRANEMLGGEKGKYDFVSCDDVNMNQEIEETVMLVGKMATIRLIKKLVVEGKKLLSGIIEKSSAYDGDLKIWVDSIVNTITRDIKRLDKSMSSLMEISLGANVLLEGEQKEEYLKKLLKNLNQAATEKYVFPENKYDVIRSLDCFMYVSTLLKNFTINFSKCAADLKIHITNGDIKVALQQEIPEHDSATLMLDMVRQMSFYIMGNDLTISRCVEEGDLNNNLYKPMIFACMNESANLVRRTVRTVREKLIEEIIL